jgi:hypothetical protein
MCQQPAQLVPQGPDESMVAGARHETQAAVGLPAGRHLRRPGLPNRGVACALVNSGEDLLAEDLTNPIEHASDVGVNSHRPFSRAPDGEAQARRKTRCRAGR